MLTQLEPMTALAFAALALAGGSMLLSVYLLISIRRSATLSRATALALAPLEEVSATLANIEDKLTGIATVLDGLDGARQQLDQRIQDVVLLAAGSAAEPTDALAAAIPQMHEMNKSFSLQYLAIQQKIQQETREINLLCNILKTKHEAAKNAINNIR